MTFFALKWKGATDFVSMKKIEFKGPCEALLEIV